MVSLGRVGLVWCVGWAGESHLGGSPVAQEFADLRFDYRKRQVRAVDSRFRGNDGGVGIQCDCLVGWP